MARKKHHEEHHEEHVDESWLVPYADILTLLLALFIVLFAAAQVDQKKFEQIAASLNVAFSGQGLLDSTSGMPQVVPGQPPASPQMSQASGLNEGKEQAFLKETLDLMEVQRKLEQYIQANSLAGDLQTVLTEDGLVIRIRDTALFPSGSASLLPQSRRFAGEIAKMLATVEQRITVSGHTDNLPISTGEFPSNWELSSRRAVNFMRYLIDDGKLKPERFSAIGYGEYRPLITNSTPEGRAKNRRVEVLLMRATRL